jgi:predicted SprT family Zn-dependent metalloprotease
MIKNETPYGAMVNVIVAKLPKGHTYSLDRITVEMNDRMRTMGGYSAYRHNTRCATVSLNRQLFERLNDAERYDIISHELAHAILQTNGHEYEHHGPRWVNLHRSLGGDGERTHDYKVKRNVVRRVIVMHKASGKCMSLTMTRWNRGNKGALLGVAAYLGRVACDLNTNTYRWEEIQHGVDKTIPLFKKLVLAS